MLYPNGSTKRPTISSPFGPRIGGAFSFHYGADCIGFRNVCAIAAGKVTFSGFLNPAAGYTVIVDHGNGVTSLYMHNHAHLVRKGDRVREGQQIAVMGDSGNATGDCVHLEIRVNGTSVEPLGYIAARLTRPTPTGGTAAPGSTATTTGDKHMIIFIRGKAGARSGGVYVEKAGKLHFIGADNPGNLPTFTDEAQISRLVKLYPFA